MRTITDLVRPAERRRRERATLQGTWQRTLVRWGWFVALWCAGVAGTALLALPFKLIIATAR